MSSPAPITVSVLVSSSIDHAWHVFTHPAAVRAWNFASPEWCCPRAVSDLRRGGSFSYRMEAKDGSMGFDFEGTFIEVEPGARLAFELTDRRVVKVDFSRRGGLTEVRQTFEPDAEAPLELQRAGWQAILDNYRLFAESAETSDAKSREAP